MHAKRNKERKSGLPDKVSGFNGSWYFFVMDTTLIIGEGFWEN